MRRLASGAAALLLAAAAPTLPHSTLGVRTPHGWRVWWTAQRAPVRWTAPLPALEDAVVWHAARPGVEWSEVALAGSGEAWRTRLVLARLDPARLRFTLDTAFAGDGAAAWRLGRTADDAVFAVNTGQFIESLPWGGVVLDGRPWLAPARGPLVATVAVDSSGTLRWAAGDDGFGAVRQGARGVAWAFQSYPVLLAGGDVPPPLQAPGRGLDVAHRDARAAIGLLGDGRLLVALTRFDALGGSLGFVPFGLTTPEMAAVMGALGARDAVMLDGGISAQMLVRDADGRVHAWPGVRAVPLALVAYPRD